MIYGVPVGVWIFAGVGAVVAGYLLASWWKRR